MKKSFNLLILGLLFSAMVINFTSCAGEAPEEEKKSSSNKLAGNTYGVSSNSNFYVTFDKDTYTSFNRRIIQLTYFDEDLINQDNLCEDTVYIISYTLNTKLGLMFIKTLSEQKSYSKNGTTLYTVPDTLPATKAEYIQEKIKMYKAIDPNFNEANAEKLYYKDFSPYVGSVTELANFTENLYTKWKAYKELQTKLEKEFVTVMAYKIDGDKLIMSEDDIEYIPDGVKFGEIFSTRYEYYCSSKENVYYNGDPSMPTFKYRMCFNSGTLANRNPTIQINSDDGSSETEYVLLDATDDNLVLAEKTSYEYGMCIYDETKPINCPVTYEEGENKDIAKVDIEGTVYSFEIEHYTKEQIAEFTEPGARPDTLVKL